ncbi:BACON domain-containing protein [Pedobacter nyackensis]|uniref:Putative binding domain-containing protein, N-terminal n=1 Tax=Pedobacter nyackensis TaxID=475255 RepID=A0A1W2B6K6_9SPHI|nr:BACON domain-containing carbohydrate-binding protein [Pedobacter nyackensis]SMC68401.1 Putative binding domain-containing protein, N-terminal [Pedobacter nyackensis]
MKAYLNRTCSFLLLLAMIAITGCRKVDAEGFSPDDPDLSFKTETMEVGSEATELEIEIKSNLPWRVKSDADWLSFVSANGTGNGTFKISVAKNKTTIARTAEISAWVTDGYKKVLKITQLAGDAPPDFTRHFYVRANGSSIADGLSWQQATTLDNALDQANDGDFIYVAAGTYKPGTTLSNGTVTDAKENTFEIRTNVQISGGYAENAQTGDQPNPQLYPTILSGNLGSSKARHVVAITAPLADGKKVVLRGLTIKEGEAGGTGSVVINGASFSRAHGGGMIIGNTLAEIENCNIINNTTNNHAPGLYVTERAVLTLKNCNISGNTGNIAASNGGGIWNDGSTIYMYNTSVNGNRVGGVGAGVYAIHTTRPSVTQMFNVTISNNVTGIYGANSAAAGYYGRERSEGLMLNCTVSGNAAGGNAAGGGIVLYGSAKLDVINSTITNNSGAVNATTAGGSGINVTTTGTNVLNLYNSIVSGNKGAFGQIVGTITTKSAVAIGDQVYDNNEALVPNAVFDAAILGPLANNGGNTQTVLLLNNTNPATQYGMSLLQLQLLAIKQQLDDSIITKDQRGQDRKGKTTMGSTVN